MLRFRGDDMTNGEQLLLDLSIDDIAHGIQAKYCAQSNCEKCPLRSECNKIFDILSSKNRKAPEGIQVITYWLNDGKDYIFYSHKKTNKQKPQSSYEAQYNFRNSCNACGKPTNTYGLARISISDGNQNYKLIGKICESCFPRICKALKIEKPDFLQPYFKLPKKQRKQSNKIYCANCGKSSPCTYNYCPKCGEILDK